MGRGNNLFGRQLSVVSLIGKSGRGQLAFRDTFDVDYVAEIAGF